MQGQAPGDPGSIYIVIPAYNEGSVLENTLRPLIENGFSVVVVDDGSTDGTLEKLRSLPIYRLRHPVNLGQGAALQTGMSFALKKGAQVVVTFDADGQHRARDIMNLVQPVLMHKADVSLGSRFLRAAHQGEVPFSKRLLLRGAVMVNGLLTGLWLSDAHNGLRAFSREAAEKIALRENGYAHASEMMIQIKNCKLRYHEVPTKIIYSRYAREKGQSFWNAINIVIDMILRRMFR